MDIATLKAFAFMAERGIAIYKALKGASEAAIYKESHGGSFTIDDLKQYGVADDAAREVLVQAIDHAESE